MMNAARARVFLKVFTAGFVPFAYFTSKYPLFAVRRNQALGFVSALSAFVSESPNGSAQRALYVTMLAAMCRMVASVLLFHLTARIDDAPDCTT